MRRLDVQVDALHEQRPAAASQRAAARAARSARDAATSARRRARPAATRRRRRAASANSSRARSSAGRVGHRPAHQQRLLLPVPAHEIARRQAAEQRRRPVRCPCIIVRSSIRCRSRAPCVVSLTWRLADAQGEEIDELTEPVEFFFGGDDLLAKVEEALAGQEAGFADDAAPRARACLRRLRPRARLLRVARDLSRGDRARHAVRRPAARRRHRACPPTRSTP